MAAISKQAVPIISQFTTQNLSNTVWAYATLKVNLDESSPELPNCQELPAMPDFSTDEVCEALLEQGLHCEELAQAAVLGGFFDSAGVLLITGEPRRYFACTKTEGGFKARDVLRNSEKSTQKEDFLEMAMASGVRCFRVRRSA